MCCVRTGMSFSVEATGPQPHFRIMPWTLALIPLHLEWRFFPPIFRPRRSQLHRWRSQDQAHGNAAQSDWRWRDTCCPSMINAVRSNADAAQDFKDQRTSSSRVASTRRKASASLQGPAGFCFASRRKFIASLQGPADFFFTSSLTGGWMRWRIEAKTDVFFYDSVRDVCGWFSSPCKYAIFAGRAEGLCCALQVCSLVFIFCITGAGASTCLCMYLHVIVCHIYIPSVSIHTMVPVHIWYIYSLSAFYLWIGFSIFVLFRVCMSFHIYTCLSIGVRRTEEARLNSCYTQIIPLRVIHVCLRMFAFHLCIRLGTICFKFL